jgi:VIT1/CCC1 family predicted Fe2+/Mn2+ transporter
VATTENGGTTPAEEAGRAAGTHPAESADPTLVRDQPALTTSTGTIWLVVGGLFAAVSLGMLIPMAILPGGTVAVIAAIVVAALYLGMVVVRLAIPSGRRRLGVLATGMVLIAVVAFAAVLIVAGASWSATAV